MKDGIGRQKDWCEILLNNVDTPIYTSRNWRDKSNSFVPGKQKCLGTQLPPLDHRSIGSNEIVIELDAKAFSTNSKYAKEISEYLKSQEIPHYVFWSGNKGLHIHIFLNIDIQSDKIKEVVKEAIRKGCNIYKAIRIKLANEIVSQAGLDPNLIGIGKIIDLAKLSWNDVQGKTCLIRICGGANKKVDVVGTVKTAFKTYLETIPTSKPKTIDFLDVQYPTLIEKYNLDESVVYECAKEYLEMLTPAMAKEVAQIDYRGKYLSLPCVQKLLEGVIEGKRSFAAQQIAISCRLDRLSKKKAVAVIGQFSQNCTPVLNEGEGKKWTEWVYKQIKPYFACGLCIKLDACETISCPYHKEKYKEEMALLDVEDPFTVIKEILDKLIVGEDQLKMCLFMICLTKYFDPKWLVMLDGESSSGKSHVLKAVVSLFGKKNYEIFSRITGAVLNRLKEGEWDNKLIVVEEIQGARAAIEQLRVAISEGVLNLIESVEVKNPDGTKGFESKQRKLVFKNVLVLSCNAEEEDAGSQLATRSWIMNTDSSVEQTKAIIKREVDYFAGRANNDITEELVKCATCLEMLEMPDEVIFPFDDSLLGSLIGTDTRGRRDVKKLIAMIGGVSRFNGRKRHWYVSKQGKRVLIADWRDVALVIKYAGEILNATSQGIGKRDIQAYNEIALNYGKVYNQRNEPFTIEDACRWIGHGMSTAKKAMANLVNAGFFVNESPQGGFKIKAQYKFVRDPIPYTCPMDLINHQIDLQEVIIGNHIKKCEKRQEKP